MALDDQPRAESVEDISDVVPLKQLFPTRVRSPIVDHVILHDIAADFPDDDEEENPEDLNTGEIASGKVADDVLYYDGEFSIDRSSMITLGSDKEICSSIVDAWARHLNAKCRKYSIYFSTSLYQLVCQNTILPDGTDLQSRITAFVNKVSDEMKVYKVKSLYQYKQFFFPVVAHNHFYLLCINMFTFTIDIIDNRKHPTGVDVEDKYGDDPLNMLKAFAAVLKAQKFKDSEIAAIENFEPKLIKMKWMSSSKNLNCGVYLIKHMETDTADPSEKWVCDLKANNAKQMRQLRAIYCAELILSEVNQNGFQVRKAAKRFAEGKE